MKLTLKQTQALDLLTDQVTTECLFGGGAGGGKSALGCYWILKSCLDYPGTRWLIGRAKLKTLKETTLLSMWDIMRMQGIDKNLYNYNSQSNTITLFNGSMILLKDLFYYPSDPDFDELGSLEITGAFIDEASQITVKAKSIVKSRIRFKLDENNLIPKVLMTTNPARGWIFDQFYEPYINGDLKKHRRFIQSLYKDNPNLSKHYADNLDSLDDISRKRLKLGDWNYLDDPAILVEFDAVDDLFTNDHIKPNGTKRISADLAMKGRDKFIVGLDDGGVIRIVSEKAKTSGKEIEYILRDLIDSHKVGHSNVVADSDGLGAYLESYIKNIKEFHGGARSFDKVFNNLKSECGFKLAELINRRELYIIATEDQRSEIKRQLMTCLKRDKMDIDDGKKKLISKEKMKESLGNSPDHLDMLLMLMYFRLRKSYF